MTVFEIVLLIEVGVIAVVNLLGAIPPAMIILGLVLLILGVVLNLGILTTIGIILLIVGAVLWILGSTGRPVGGRARWY